MAPEPLVSVATPVHNGAEFLAECIESVLAQTHGNFEYVILDNGSTDGSAAVALKYAEQDGRIRVEKAGEPVAEIERHNIAFRRISPAAKYCKVVSPEDIIFPECLTRMVELAEANPSVGMVGSYQLVGDRVRWQGFDYPQTVVPGAEVCRRVFLGSEAGFGFGTPTSMLYRADLVRSSSAFYPGTSPHADASACFKYLKNSDFGFVFRVLSVGRAHERLESIKSAKINRFAWAYVRDLVDYGPLYLNRAELTRRLREQIDEYDRFLVVNLLSRRGSEFWDYHRSSLEDLGYPLTPIRLLKAATALVLREGLNPGNAIARLRKRVGTRTGAANPRPFGVSGGET